MPLTANFLADFSSYLAATRQSIAATKEFEQAAAHVGPAVDKSVQQSGSAADQQNQQGFAAGAAIGTALASEELRRFAREAKGFAEEYIKEFAESEAATSRLTAALKANALATPEIIKQYDQMATALQKVSRFSDEQIKSAQTMLTTIGNIKPDQMEATLKTVMDLAVGMNIPLERASKLVAEAAATGGEKLGKLKALLHDDIEKGADFTEVMAALHKEFGGQFAADVDTTTGSMLALKNQMSDVNEEVGKVFAANLKVLLGLFQSMPEGLQTVIIAVVGIGTALAPVLLSLTSLVTLLSTPAIGAALTTAFAALLPFLGPAGLIAVGLVGLFEIWKHWDQIVDIAKRVYEGVKLWLWDKLSALVNGIVGLPAKVIAAFAGMAAAVVLHSSVPDMVDGIRAHFGRLDAVMVQPALAAAADVAAGFADLASSAQDALVGGDGLTLDQPRLTPAAAAGVAGGTTTVTNTFYVNGSIQDLARGLMAEITRSMKVSKQWPAN